MKKAFLFLFPTLLFSCTEKEQFITLSDSDVTIFYDGSKQLSVNYSSDELKSKTYSYSTSDSTVVKVNESGLVSGVCIGSAIVKISSNDGKYNDECRFTVSPKSTLYKEPYTVFGASISTIKSKETRSLYSETTTSLVYTDTDTDVRNVAYLFENGKSTSALVTLTQTNAIATEVTTFLKERYQYLGVSSGVYYFKDRKSGIGAALQINVSFGLSVMYLPSNSSSVPAIKVSEVQLKNNHSKLSTESHFEELEKSLRTLTE